jgi:hypothetical protein
MNAGSLRIIPLRQAKTGAAMSRAASHQPANAGVHSFRNLSKTVGVQLWPPPCRAVEPCPGASPSVAMDAVDVVRGAESRKTYQLAMFFDCFALFGEMRETSLRRFLIADTSSFE